MKGQLARMSKKAKIIELLETAGKLYFYLVWDERHKNILTRGIDLLFYKDVSFPEKVLLVYAKLTGKHSERIMRVKVKYADAYNYSKGAILRSLFDSFGFSEFVTLPVSENNPDPYEATRCFFSSCNEIFHSDIYRLDRLLDDDDVIIDGGGNIGLFSLYALNLSNNVCCLVFEPEEQNFQALKKNIQHYKNVRLFNEGLSDTVEERELLVSTNILMHKLNSESIDFDLESNYYGVQKVRLNTIDNVVLETNTKIDLIKLDIEGNELPALRGAVNTIERCSPLLLIAIDHSEKQALKIARFFREHFETYSSIRLNNQNVLFYDPKKHPDRIRRLQDEKGN